ncbi:hypothetical protein E2562_032861 [Oryza meyeriana var. granulata]|uniref:Pentacotripeptide-repeat region of PRORP domain-containing protein n=1 Tax=Oryza meyeriana var. granulata TaxID=110450 RepID=A0A6G1BPW5_9ORYZ|nr:hypothetical protein E2562_032861 [Oryza meyeriana var. granulata]
MGAASSLRHRRPTPFLLSPASSNALRRHLSPALTAALPPPATVARGRLSRCPFLPPRDPAFPAKCSDPNSSPPSNAHASDNHHHHARLRTAAARSDLPGAMAAFAAMSSAGARPILRTFTSLLKLCAARGDLATGRAVHAQLAARGLDSEALAATALANMYARCHRPADARRVFD